MKKNFFIILLGITLIGMLPACVDKREILSVDKSQTLMKEPALAEPEDVNEEFVQEEQMQETSFGSVPYFRDDTGKWMQAVDGFVYTYQKGTLCKYNTETLEKTILYETFSSHNIDFTVYEGYVYFTDRPYTNSLSGADTTLYRVKCDGTELTKLKEDIPNVDDYFTVSCQVEIYEDTIYLMDGDTLHLCYRMQKDGTLAEVPIEKTLYGLLPENYRAAFHTLPYCMRNYGYVFAWEEEQQLVQIAFSEEGILESTPIALPANDGILLTHDALLCRSDVDNQWYRLLLDDLDNPISWTVMDYQYTPMNWSLMNYQYAPPFYWDEAGAYFLSRNDQGSISVINVDWDGNQTTLLSRYPIKVGIEDSYGISWQDAVFVDEDYFYYNGQVHSDRKIMRLLLQGEEDAELVDAYYHAEIDSVSTVIEEEKMIEVEENVYFATKFARLHMNGETEGEKAINSFLEVLYQDIEEEMENNVVGYADYINEDENYKTDFSSYEVSVFIEYLSENYVVIGVSYYSYWWPGAHGSYWLDEYVFDRTTGKRLAITDLVSNSEEEIYAIVMKYILKDFEEAYYAKPEKDTVMEQDRFFLTEEGIGIHFDVYEIADYATGAIDFVIPYSEFEMK